MKTILCDIDGTLTNMWSIECAVLREMLGEESSLAVLHAQGITSCYELYCRLAPVKLGKKVFYQRYNQATHALWEANRLPVPQVYPLVEWIKKHANDYTFVFVTGGQSGETAYVLKALGIYNYFDHTHGIAKDNYPFAKKTGKPFRYLQRLYGHVLLITDSESDCDGAREAGIPYFKWDSGIPMDSFRVL